jgi:tetratricopeptide (TPR) repeat protein
MDADGKRTVKRHRQVWVRAGFLALAAALAVVVVAPRLLDRLRPTADSSTLATAVGPKRLTEPRLAGGFAYGPLVGDTRAGDAPVAPPEVIIAAARAEQALARRKDIRTLTAYGAGQLLTGNVDQAVATLEEAHALDGSDAAVLIDLSSAYYEKSRRVPEDQARILLDKAIAAATEATRVALDSPEAWFNRALLQEKRGDVADSMATWRRFLDVERDPGWLEEGRRHLDALERHRR